MTLSMSQRGLEQGSIGSGEESLLLLLRQAEGALRGRLQRTLDEAGLSLEHWRIVACLREQPGQRMTAVAAATVLPSASVTRHVDRLVERGVVVRRVDPHDRRSVVLALSPQGETLAGRVRGVEKVLEEQLAHVLGGEAFAVVRGALASMPDALR